MIGIIHHNSHLLLWILGLAAFGLLIMLFVILFTNGAFKKAIKKKDQPPEAKVVKKAKPAKMPPPYGRLAEFLSLKGFFKVGELSLTFLKAIHFLRSHVGGNNPLYHLPWYLMVGATGSGKSTMIRHSSLKLPVGEPTFGEEGKPDCKWWFLDKGVFLDVRGNFFINHKNDKANEVGWRNLISLLARYRAKRPLDGIILTIPASEFVGKDALSYEELVERAKIVAQKLHSTQHNLGLMLPIYLVITKSDHIPGFRSFCSQLPTENQRNMLGWSNPYAVTTAYNKIWIDQAFGYIKQFLGHLRLEMFAEKDALDARDGIFILPTQIATVKDGITTYIEHIFKESAYEEGLFLRGLYFTGDGANHTIAEFTAANDIKEEDEKELAGKRKIFFIEDLVERKIFTETGLSQPLRNRAARANRNLRIAKFTTAAAVTVSTFGVMHTYDKFKDQNEDILPILSKINLVLSQLQHLRGADSIETVSLFDSYAKQLIQMMSTLSSSSFSSVFIPASWFSPIKMQLDHSLRISYNHIVLRTIYIDLLLKGRELLYLRPSPESRSKTLAQLIDPVTSNEFDYLRSYVMRINELAHMINLFNDLTKSNDVSPLRDLVRFTFNSELPQAFEDEFHHFRKVLRDVPFPPIDLVPYEVLAQDTLRTAYKFFLESIFSKTDPLSIVGRLNLFLWNYSNKEAQELPNLNQLRQLAIDLDQAVPKLGTPGKTWMDGDYFDAGPDFIALVGLIHDSPLLGGKKMVEELAADTAVLFNDFKAEMLRLLPIISEEPILNPMADVKGLNTPSMVLYNLNKSLSGFFKEPFMAIPTTHQLITVVPENKVVFWDPKLVENAEDMVKRFEDFRSKTSFALPQVIRENIALLAQANLQANVLSTLARAQSFVDAPRAVTIGIAGEEIIHSKINNIKDVAPRFITLLEALNKGNSGESFIAVRNLIGQLALRLLENVENAAMDNPPYSIKDNSFTWWDGNNNGIYAAFNVKDSDDLRAYLDLQHDRIKHWALNYAKYLVDFLRADIMRDSNLSRTLVDRWYRIILQVNLADTKKPDNSIIHLQNELKRLNDVTLKTCFKDIKLSEIKESSGDFFLAIERMIKREMHARCEIITRKHSFKHYNKLRDFFNERLKDKFPFVSNIKASKGEADPEDLREFFKMYKEYGNSPEIILSQIAELGRLGAEPLKFLRSMHKIKEFLGDFIQSEEGGLPGVEFSVDFRVNKQEEQEANSIVEWYFKPADETKIDKHQKDRSGKWVYGNLSEFGFRWAEGIDVGPTLDEGQKFMSVEDGTAKFTFTSNWSLLYLIQTYGQSKPAATEPSPYLLKFIIPIDPEKKAIVFTKITLNAPAKGKTPGRVVEVPYFPASAPEMPDEVEEIGDDAVITKGRVKVVDLDQIPEKEKKEDDKKKDKPKDKKEEPAKEDEGNDDDSENDDE